MNKKHTQLAQCLWGIVLPQFFTQCTIGYIFSPNQRSGCTDHGFINESTIGTLSFLFKIPGWRFNKGIVGF